MTTVSEMLRDLEADDARIRVRAHGIVFDYELRHDVLTEHFVRDRERLRAALTVAEEAARMLDAYMSIREDDLAESTGALSRALSKLGETK